jgi:hypothetical protein
MADDTSVPVVGAVDAADELQAVRPVATTTVTNVPHTRRDRCDNLLPDCVAPIGPPLGAPRRRRYRDPTDPDDRGCCCRDPGGVVGSAAGVASADPGE